MHDAGGVRRLDRVEHRTQDAERLDRRQRAALVEELGQVAPGHVLEHQIEVAALLAGLEDRHHGGVAQLADGARLGQQDLILGRVGPREMQRLDRHLALQLRVETAIDDALGAAPEFAADLETADAANHFSPPSVTVHASRGTPSAAPQTIAFWP